MSFIPVSSNTVVTIVVMLPAFTVNTAAHFSLSLMIEPRWRTLGTTQASQDGHRVTGLDGRAAAYKFKHLNSELPHKISFRYRNRERLAWLSRLLTKSFWTVAWTYLL